MEIVLYVAGAAALLLGLLGVVLPVLPGGPLLFAGALLVAWAGHFRLVGWPTLVVVGLLAAAIVAADFLATALGARLSGASRWAVVGASLGLVVGLFFGPIGLLLGPPLGAILLELWRDPDLEAALKAGAGTLVGFLVGGLVKVLLAFALLSALGIGLLVS